MFRRKSAAVWSPRPVGRGLRFPAGDLEMDVTGLRQHAAAVDALVTSCAPTPRWVGTVTVRLVREPDNPHDGNAVVVYVDPHGPVGHLDGDDARTFGPLLDEVVRSSRTPMDLLATARLVTTPGPDHAGVPEVALTLLLPRDLGTRPI